MAKKPEPLDAAKAVPAPAAYFRLLLRHFGADPDIRRRLLEGAEIDEAALAKPGAEVSLFTILRFSERLCDVVGDDWPLQCRAVWGVATQGALEVAARTAATVGEGLAVIARFGHVRGPFLSLRIKRDAKKTTLSLASTAPAPEHVMRAMLETSYLSAKSMLDILLGGGTDQLTHRFAWPPPKHANALREVLGGRVEFNARECAISVPNALCDQPSPYADETLHVGTLAELEQGANRITHEDTLILKIQRLLKRRRTSRLTEEEAAAELGLSRRTLVRRLSDSGTSFRELLDAHLKARAGEMLAAKKLSRDEMAEALGFNDPTSFSRACRRWFPKEK